MAKYLFHYKRYGLLRYLSHLETMKTVEKLLRRSGIKLKQTEGFHQRMKISFAQALPTGIIDLAGMFAVTALENLDDEYVRFVNAIAPRGLEITKVVRVEDGFKLSKFVKGYEFEMVFALPPKGLPFEAQRIGNFWLVKLYRPFNSSVPKSGEYGQFLTLRKKAVIVGGAN